MRRLFWAGNATRPQKNMHENITPSERKSLDLLSARMSYYSYGSHEYELCRKAFASLCNLIRARERSDQETQARHLASRDEEYIIENIVLGA